MVSQCFMRVFAVTNSKIFFVFFFVMLVGFDKYSEVFARALICRLTYFQEVFLHLSKVFLTELVVRNRDPYSLPAI